VVTSLAGSAFNAGSTDGAGTLAGFNHPRGIATDNAGNLYVVDSGNNTIRRVLLISPRHYHAAAKPNAHRWRNRQFSVAASGTQPLSYQWQLNGTNLAGAVSSSLAIPNVQPTSAGAYRVVVSNVASSFPSADAVLTVICPNQSPTVVGSAVIGSMPSQIAVNPNTDRVFLAGGYGESSGVLILSVVNKASPEVMAGVAGGAGVAVNPAANRLYTSGGYNGTILVYDATPSRKSRVCRSASVAGNSTSIRLAI